MPTMCTNLQRLLTAALEDLCITDVTINYNVTGIFVITSKLTFISSGVCIYKSHLMSHRETN